MLLNTHTHKKKKKKSNEKIHESFSLGVENLDKRLEKSQKLHTKTSAMIEILRENDLETQETTKE